MNFEKLPLFKATLVCRYIHKKMKKTKLEKAAVDLANLISDYFFPQTKELAKEYNIDTAAMIAWRSLSKKLRKKRSEINNDFKNFYKQNKLRQYKIKEIEGAGIQRLDLEELKRYISIINAEKEVSDWIKKFPNIAKKYKITV